MTTEGAPDPASEPVERPEPPTAPPSGGPAAPGPDRATGSPYPPAGSAGPGPAYGDQQTGHQHPGYGRPAYGPPPDYGQRPYSPPPGYRPTGYGAAAPLSPSDERMWATLAHVGPILVGFLAPLIIWLVFRERSRFVDDQGKEALNFQIFLAIVYVVGVITAALVIGIFILLAAWLLAIVFGIQGAIAANRGELYRYPFNWRVIK